MKAREADLDGFVEHDGVKIHYEVHGDQAPTILLLPTWTIVHKRFWKMQVAYLARHFRVIVYDGPGNGRSSRPTTARAYDHDRQVAYAVKVLDATGTDRAVVVGLSKAANWALQLAADHGERVLGTVLVAPAVALEPPHPVRAKYMAFHASRPETEPSRVPLVQADPPAHWAKYNREYWLRHYEDFVWFFLGQCFSERHSTKAIEDGVGWGLETSGENLAADAEGATPDATTLEGWCRRLTGPVMLIHGDEDHLTPVARSENIAELTRGELVVIEGGGHIPMVREPVRINLLLREFAERFRPSTPRRRVWPRWDRRPKRVLYISSPIGLGHARRDLAIAQELRKQQPGIEIDWLAQHPVTRVLEHAGERVHPASRFLASESAHIEAEAAEHDLHCFEALRRMDEILLANFMVFHDLAESERYDLVIGDEAWDVDHFLHENPELKRFAFAWMTDFVGYLPMPGGGDREALVAADYNAEMIGHIARNPRIRDRAVFVGNPDDIVESRFGPDLPFIRDWTSEHYEFAGYVTGFDPAEFADREALRAQLGYGPDERVCVVSVGGSGVGADLLRCVIGSFPEVSRLVPDLRMIVVTGPRIDPTSLPSTRGLEVRAYVRDLHRHLAACDIAIVQGGLTTCMELTASRTPFIYVPLRNHFEQNFHVAHRLRRYSAGRRLDYADITPSALAEMIAVELGRDVTYRPVETDGAARAAALLAALL